VIERLFLPVLTLVKPVEPGSPLDPDLVLLGDVSFDVASGVLVPLRIIAPNILSAELNTGLLRGWADESDQGLNVDDSSKI
jgi:hypothetical protein